MQTVASIALQLIKAIAYLHSRNIVHRDIKLQNVLIQKEKIKLIDFGFSCLSNYQSTQPINSKNSPRFAELPTTWLQRSLVVKTMSENRLMYGPLE